MKRADFIKCNLVNATDRSRVRRLVRKFKLDRRKVYVIGYFGELATDEKCTTDCSGCSCDCSDGYGCSHGCAGCDECGYTGKRVQHFPDPVKVGDRYIQVEKYHCPGCGKLQEHFDSGCEECAAKCFKP